MGNAYTRTHIFIKWWKINWVSHLSTYAHTTSSAENTNEWQANMSVILWMSFERQGMEKACDYFWKCLCVCVNLDRQPLTTVIQNSVCRTASQLIRCRPPQPQISAYHDVYECSWLYMSGSIMCSRKSSHSHYSNNNRISNAPSENCTNTSQAFEEKSREKDRVRNSVVAIAV